MTDGMPIPPPRLIFRVANTPDLFWYFDGGRKAADSIITLLEKNSIRIGDCGSILDFGCGCGRVIRQLLLLKGPTFFGRDLNTSAISWCKANLKSASFATNRLVPPLSDGPETYDLVYALSVFTHLPEASQRGWVDELARILRPGGHLVLSTHGEYYFSILHPGEQKKFRDGEIVTRFESAAGSNLCTSFQSQDAVRQRLTRILEVIDYIPEGALGNPHQDLYLLRKTRGTR
jgi:SAM-dependent methyltransferase